jgi:hypothetical protein
MMTHDSITQILRDAAESAQTAIAQCIHEHAIAASQRLTDAGVIGDLRVDFRIDDDGVPHLSFTLQLPANTHDDEVLS